MLNLLSCSHWRDLFFSAGDIASQYFTIFTPGFSAFVEDARPKQGVVTKVVIFQLTRFIGITTWC